MEKAELVRQLEEMADLAEVASDSPFRARSWRAAARAVDGLSADLGELVRTGEIRRVKGIGESIAGFVLELWHEGRSHRLDELHREVPPGVRRMLRVPGLGPKKVRALWTQLGLRSVEDLAAACRDGRVASLAGFGERSQEKILQGIAYLQAVAGRFLLSEAEPYARGAVEWLRRGPPIRRLEVAGSWRRRCETVKDLDLLVCAEDPAAVAGHFVAWEAVGEVTARGSTKTSVRLENGMACDLRLVPEASFPFALGYFTGSKEHNTALRGLARERGLKLNEYGLFPEDSETSRVCEDETALYAALGLQWIPPELREGLDEIELARTGRLPDLVDDEDIRGVVHLHTTWSDGKASLEAMARAARERGYGYIGVTDHSVSAFYAGGLDADALLRQREEVDRLNEELAPFRIFHGIESDIRADGSLDYPPEVLDRLDFVIASLHGSLRLPEGAMTERVLRALEDPHTTLLGHLTARLLLRREPVALDVGRILARAAELGVAVEINANPRRLDLDWRHGPRARELGLLTSVNPDAHSVEGIDDIRWGVGIARKAGFEVARVMNTLDAAGFERFLRRRTG